LINILNIKGSEELARFKSPELDGAHSSEVLARRDLSKEC
jgi:hypothetical protein